MIRHDPPPLAVGLDVGRTWIRLLARAGSRRVARVAVRAGAPDELPDFLARLWRRRRWTRASVAVLVVASRGLWTPRECAALERRLRHLARRVRVLSDAQAALLGALGERPGLLVLAGTGSIVIGRNARGRWGRAGGFGPLLGDEGSGFWLGREWLRATTEGEDFEPVRALVRAPDAVARIAALAPRVLARARAGDRRAQAIVRDAQRHLARFAGVVARRLRLDTPVSVSWAGSVLEDRRYRAGVARALQRSGVRARWLAPALEPVDAAARLAAEMATSPRR